MGCQDKILNPYGISLYIMGCLPHASQRYLSMYLSWVNSNVTARTINHEEFFFMSFMMRSIICSGKLGPGISSLFKDFNLPKALESILEVLMTTRALVVALSILMTVLDVMT